MFRDKLHQNRKASKEMTARVNKWRDADRMDELTGNRSIRMANCYDELGHKHKDKYRDKKKK